jgi:chemotaxis protein histidine kinase CheA
MPSPNQTSRRSGSMSLANTGAALRRGDLKISDPIPFDEGGMVFNGPSTVPPSSYHLQTNDATWPRKSASMHDAHGRHVSEVQDFGVRASAGPSLLQSSMSSIPSKGSLNQRKQGGLRAALKRMFSSKKHRSVPTDSSGLHYSNSSQLRPVAENPVRKRLDSAPTLGGEFAARNAALTSHSHPYEQPESAYQTLPSPPRRGRRNTLPSLVFSDRDSGLVPTTTDWPSTYANLHEAKPKDDEISEHHFKRRSRSADALNEMVRQGAVDRPSTQDRAGTIAFWRNSAVQNPIPIYSGQSITVDPAHVPASVDSGEGYRHPVSKASPMQTFDFGLGIPERDDPSLEQRLGTLEVKIFDFEFALAKLQGHNIPNPRFKAATLGRQPVHNVMPQNEANLSVTTSSTNDLTYLSASSEEQPLTFLSSPGESPLPSPEGDDMFRPQRASKATTATIRPASAHRKSPTSSRSSSPSSIHIPARKFEALLDLVKEEKVARLRLEEQVKALQKEMETLRFPVYATVQDAYPTPSPDSTQTTPSSSRTRTLHRTHGFAMIPAPPEISRFSGTEDSDGEGDDGYDEVFETPKEEQRNTFETARASPRKLMA